MTVTIDKITIKCDTCGQAASWGGTPKENVPVAIVNGGDSVISDLELVLEDITEGWGCRGVGFYHRCPECDVLENSLEQVNAKRKKRGLKPLIKETA